MLYLAYNTPTVNSLLYRPNSEPPDNLPQIVFICFQHVRKLQIIVLTWHICCGLFPTTPLNVVFFNKQPQPKLNLSIY